MLCGCSLAQLSTVSSSTSARPDIHCSATVISCKELESSHAFQNCLREDWCALTSSIQISEYRLQSAKLQYSVTDRWDEENVTSLPTSAGMDNSNGAMPTISSGFALLGYRWNIQRRNNVVAVSLQECSRNIWY